MIRKSGNRFSEKIMRKQRDEIMAGGNVLAAMTVAMPMPVRSMRRTPETAIRRVAISCGTAVWAVLRRR
jgi:hypothetical protein